MNGGGTQKIVFCIRGFRLVFCAAIQLCFWGVWSSSACFGSFGSSAVMTVAVCIFGGSGAVLYAVWAFAVLLSRQLFEVRLWGYRYLGPFVCFRLCPLSYVLYGIGGLIYMLIKK